MSQVAPITVDAAIVSKAKMGNPAVVGLAGFGLTTMMLQFHNLGWSGVGPVIYLGMFFGGLAQMIAGLQEHKTGNNFGYCAFTAYGCFWISLCGILLGNKYDVFKSSPADVGWFLVAWTLFTFILMIGAMKISKAMFLTFFTLDLGFLFLDLAHFTESEALFAHLAGMVLMVCACSAWYMMAHVILGDLFGRDVLPVGKPVL